MQRQTAIDRWRILLPIAVPLLIAMLVLFLNPFRYSLPLGYAGLFALIAYLISKNGFVLPAAVPCGTVPVGCRSSTRCSAPA